MPATQREKFRRPMAIGPVSSRSEATGTTLTTLPLG